jgi:hypothetical protein
MKVAQYEVLGRGFFFNDASRTGRSIACVREPACGAKNRAFSIVPNPESFRGWATFIGSLRAVLSAYSSASGWRADAVRAPLPILSSQRLTKKKRQANCLPRVKSFRIFRLNRHSRLSLSIFSPFGDQGRPLCCPSSRSAGIERYPGSEQTCRPSDIQHLP